MLASELEERHSGSAERTPMPMFAELVSPERLVFSGEVESILLPGVEGDMTILPGHAPLITMLNPGVVLARDTAGQARRAFVRGGVVEVTGSKVTILAERVAAIEEVTTEFLDAEILQLEMTRDASMDQTARIQANIAIARLEEFKGSLNLIKAT
jgi:F-type H+-transporting ATPase subunit epsilon